MTSEKLKETRMKIAYNVIQSLMPDSENWKSNAIMVEYAYKVADEILKQGGYNV
jgi:hypothetical protein